MLQQNYLNPNDFIFVIDRIPNTSLFVQSINVPGISMNNFNLPTPFKSINLEGSTLEYEQLLITMAVSENLENYMEIFDWMEGLTKPNNFNEFKKLKESPDSIFSDARLVIFNSKKNPTIEINFIDVFPISLGQIQLSTTNDSVIVPTVDVSFSTFGHTIKRLNN